MNPEVTMESALAPITPTKSASRIWRIVGLVVGFQALIVLAGVLLFSGMGLANEGVGSCGGG